MKLLTKKMMPNLPTDSLYKFIFVGSLFLIGLLGFYRLTERNQLINSYDAYKIQSIDLGVEFGQLKSEFEEIQYALDNGAKGLAIDSKITSYSKKFHSYSKADTILKSKIESLDDDLKNFDTNNSYYYWLIGCLVVIAFVACYFWYFRLQKYQDIIIKREAIPNENKMS